MLLFHGHRHRSSAAFRDEETDLDLTMAFLDATSGHSAMDDVQERLARSLGADAALLSRGDIRSDRSSTVARSGGHRIPAGGEGLAREILGPLYFHMRPGAACLASEHLAAASHGGAAIRELLRERALVDVGLVVLDCSWDAADYLELHFSCPPDDEAGRRLEGLARALSRVWKLAGVKSDAETRTPNDLPRCGRATSAKTEILDVRNPARLTKAEFRICLLLSRGLSAIAVARELNVSLTTVRTHLRNIYRKTEVSGFGELTYRLMSRNERVSASLAAPLTA